jgi:hypothetical protein
MCGLCVRVVCQRAPLNGEEERVFTLQHNQGDIVMRSACVGHLGLTLESIKYFAPLMLPHCCSRSLHYTLYNAAYTFRAARERERDLSRRTRAQFLYSARATQKPWRRPHSALPQRPFPLRLLQINKLFSIGMLSTTYFCLSWASFPEGPFMSMELNCATHQRCIILGCKFVFSVTLVYLYCISNLSERI